MHYLRTNDDTWTPAAIIVLDSETATEGEGRTETEVLRCWDARHVFRRHRRRAGEVLDGQGETRAECAAAIDAWACMDKSTWLYAHNAGFDLITTGLPVELARLGWEMSSRHAVSGGSPWLVLHKGRQEVPATRATRSQPGRAARVKWQHTLTICDSFSLMPRALAELAEHAPEQKPALPDAADSLGTWHERCAADVRILTWCVLTLMDWWQEHDLGKWSVSGAACGWNSYRHKMAAKSVVIDPEHVALGVEHAAVYGGRRDVFRVGDLPPGRYAEDDFTAAYPTIAATQLLPARRIGPLTPKIAAAILAGRARYGMIAECVISTDVPRWPLRIRDRVFYPVGRFQTVLAGPEIAEAARLGCLESVGDGWFYGLSDHMQTWARWVLDVQASSPEDVPYPVIVAAKAWGRSVCGKWAQRGWSTISYPGPPGDDWSYEDVVMFWESCRASICGLGGRYWLSQADQESDYEFPAVLAYIESHCRLRLARCIDSAPPGAVIQCDTDGLMVSITALEHAASHQAGNDRSEGTAADAVAAQLDAWSKRAAPLTVREKTVFQRVIVYGPQHVELDGRARFSGVPGSAWSVGDGRWMARLWPSMAWQLSRGGRRGYDRPVQAYTVIGPYAAGWCLDSGAVRAAEAHLDDDGSTRLLAWPLTRWAAAGERLGPRQAPCMKGLWDEDSQTAQAA